MEKVATDVATDVAKTCVEKLIDGAVSQTRYVCCFTSIVDKFKTQKDSLETKRRTVEQRVNEARDRGNDILYNVEEWKKQADVLIQEDTKTEKKCFFGFCPNCIWRYKMGKGLELKTGNMKQLVEEAEKFEIIEITGLLPGVKRFSSQNYIHLKGRESAYNKLLEALKDENNFITGLHGMGGSGKTTLAREVGKELEELKEFSRVVITTVSHTPDIKKIQDEIAGPLRLELGGCNESERPLKLWRRLTNGEKILVILDDVWDRKPPLDFDAIMIPNQDNHKGCRVLVTTRNARVLKQMDCVKTIDLESLSDEDAWTMFKRLAHISNSSSKSLIEKGHKIANECKGLPVVIAAVASILKVVQESQEEWDVVLKSLQNPLSSIQGVPDEMAEIYNRLKVSYNYLKDENAKELFLLCSVFPEDEEIPIETLTRLGIGAGLFGELYGTYNEARNQVVKATRILTDSSLLLEADEGSVKMHDLVREVAQWIANNEIITLNMSHKDPKSLIDRVKNTKCLFWEGKVREMFSSNFGGSKLEILIAAFDADGDRDCVEVPNSFFENMARLRALHLDHKWSCDTELAFSLPRSIQSLMNIRSLLVSRVNLGDISVLGNLQCLETLDLVLCKIIELPHEITELQKFKLLKLEDCEIKKKNPFEVIGRCISLKELYFINSFNDFCQEISLPTLQRLQRYDIARNYSRSTLKGGGSLSKFVDLRKYADAEVDIFSEATLKYFIQTAEVLALDNIKLNLKNISELQYLINTIDSRVPNVFSKLVVLTLYEMKNLEELCNGPISFDSLKELRIINCVNLRSLFKFKLDLCNLKTMTVRICPLLVSLFQLSTAQSLMMLEELEIGDCEQLESILTDEKRGNPTHVVFTYGNVLTVFQDNRRFCAILQRLNCQMFQR